MVANALRWRRAGRVQMRTRIILAATFAWAALVLAVLIWQAATYRGLAARAAELQFDMMGAYYPLVTIVVLQLLLVLPLMILLVSRLQRRRRWLQEHQHEAVLLLEGARVIRNLLLWLACAPAIAASVLFAVALTIPGDGPPHRLAVADHGRAAEVEGPVLARGTLRLSRLARYRQKLILAMPEDYYAPLTLGTGAGPVLQTFVAVDQTRPAADRSINSRAIAVRNALPGPVRQLYLNAGYRLSEPVYVLYPSIAAARAPLRRIVVLLLLVAAVLLLVCGCQQLSMRRLRRAAASELGRRAGEASLP